MISVVIPSYNSNQNIINCVKSIHYQKFKKFEIIIVDDCSTDESINNLKKFLKKKRIKKVNIIKNRKNLGPGPARNLGVKYSKYQNILFIDSDVIIKKNTLKNFSQLIGKYNVLVGVYDDSVTPGSILGNTKGIYYYTIFNKKLIKYEIFDAAIAGIKKKVFLQTSGYNLRMDKNIDFENEELSYRIREKNEIYLTNKLKVKHVWPSNKKILITLLKRSSYFVEFKLIKKNYFSNEIIGKKELLKLLHNAVFSISLISNIFYGSINILVLSLLLSISFIIINFKYFIIIRKKKLNLLKYFFSLLIIQNTAFLGLLKGLLNFCLPNSSLKKKMRK